jgi:hypothetical protein
MPLRFLLDEHLRGALWSALQQHNAGGVSPVDAVCVGDPPDLPLGSPDSEILLWAEREGRILVSRDKKSLPGHLADHLKAGHHVPGIFIVRQRCSLPQVVASLVKAVSAANHAGWRDYISHIP